MATETPRTGAALAEVLAQASGARRPVRVIGGGTRSRRGPEPEGGTRVVSTAGLAGIVDHVPADLTITVGAGTPVADLEDHLVAHRQEWAQHGAQPGSTVGGVLATGSSGRRRLAHGPVRDSLLEVVLATGDGRVVRGGGRTVKNVSGYDLPRLAVGSWGTLGVMTQVTLKLWPVPVRRAWFGRGGSIDERGALAGELLRDRAPAAIVLSPGRITVGREGQPEDVVAPAGTTECDAPPEPSGNGLMRGGVPPAAVRELAAWAESRQLPYEALAGVGSFTAAVKDDADGEAVLDRARALGGHAELVDGSPELRAALGLPAPAGLTIMRRLKSTFDPAGILNAGLLCESI